eukprot:TRINITY_DN34229_c0_g1_i1.p5 TRINITY_DN34229_c0_g1~~TRINITY_DN34229_c0_g1_i1.p5  ORF type:complete len:166 (+),score=44.53 TRINITY_DN34229_c0_g1_i1:83-580(+)
MAALPAHAHLGGAPPHGRRAEPEAAQSAHAPPAPPLALRHRLLLRVLLWGLGGAAEHPLYRCAEWLCSATLAQPPGPAAAAPAAGGGGGSAAARAAARWVPLVWVAGATDRVVAAALSAGPGRDCGPAAGLLRFAARTAAAAAALSALEPAAAAAASECCALLPR